ncbi:hypothetical protein FSP39_022387 [Pinctada imbricata]|uniref:Decaprenyl-diphosphate synthase subunit 2 n=1 Tax=Pinctada imbricata TaxID=66713 RepID=A0AA88YKM7_PINIB|nr:hypothetical protein FSP39_022387 [Pinctada imbricata]
MNLCSKCLHYIRRNPLLRRIFDEKLAARSIASFTWGSKPDEWNKAVSDAEKIVGYPTSFMSLRCLLSDEFSNIAMHMRKLVGTKHPILKTARGLVYDGKHSMQTRGLIVLLISKAAGQGPYNKDQEDTDKYDRSSGIYHSQRSLAEITELIHTANLIHKGVVNMADLEGGEGNEKRTMEFGNKMAVLCGDYLLANASTGLAELRNTYVVENMSGAIGELMEAEFTRIREEGGDCILKSEINHSDWLRQTFLSSGSLLAKSCQSALELANHSQAFQKSAFTFGENMAYAQQLCEDLKPFLRPDTHLEQLSITSLPVIKFTTKYDVQEILKDGRIVKPKKIIDVLSATPVVKECQELCAEFGDIAKDSLNDFDTSDARDALVNIVNATVKP